MVVGPDLATSEARAKASDGGHEGQESARMHGLWPPLDNPSAADHRGAADVTVLGLPGAPEEG